MLDIIRETPIGQALRFISTNRLLRYPEERPNFKIPVEYTALLKSSEDSKLQGHGRDDSAPNENNVSLQPESSDDIDLDLEMLRVVASVSTLPYTNDRIRAEQMLDIERTKTLPIAPQKTLDGIVLVDWYTTDDPKNIQNWSSFKKGFIMFILCFYIWTVYSAGPIYATAEPRIAQHFGVSPVAASLGLSLYVHAYGIGDLLFSPLTEIPVIGRNLVYYLTLIIFWVLSFPTATVNNFGGLVALRFWLGFFGSPALANGGATIGDMYSLIYIPYGLCWWVFSAWGGPAFGPLIGGFTAMAKGWRRCSMSFDPEKYWNRKMLTRWVFIGLCGEVVWMSSAVLVVMLCFMPETSASNILLRRARRLRKLTDDSRLQSQSEIDQRHMSANDVLFSALIRPIEITIKDPSCYFYGVFYTFFEVFPLVFPQIYGFNRGQTGLAFISSLIGVIVGLLGYFAYLHWYMIPDNIHNGLREQEHRLVHAIIGSFLLPVGLFIFAWTSDSNIHWAIPLLGVEIFVVGHFWTMQSLFIYIPFSYPKYAASLFAGSSILRSGVAGGSVVFARLLFINSGVHKGVTLLAGLSVVGIFGTIAIYTFGKKLRARSKFAQS